MIAGRGPAPSLVLTYVQGLPDNSLTAGLVNGGRSHYGWGVDRYLLADLFDALNVNTRATGNWEKGKAPKFPEWPRPSDKPATSDGAPKKVTVADLHRKFSIR